MLDLIDAGADGLTLARALVERVSNGDTSLPARVHLLGDVRLRSPIPRPRNNVICVGLNYRSHAVQNARALAQRLEFPGAADLPLEAVDRGVSARRTPSSATNRSR